MEMKMIFIAIVTYVDANFNIFVEENHFDNETSAENWASKIKTLQSEMIRDGELIYKAIRSDVERHVINSDDLQDAEIEYEVVVKCEREMVQTFTITANSEEEARRQAIDEAESDDWDGFAVDIWSDEYEIDEISEA